MIKSFHWDLWALWYKHLYQVALFSFLFSLRSCLWHCMSEGGKSIVSLQKYCMIHVSSALIWELCLKSPRINHFRLSKQFAIMVSIFRFLYSGWEEKDSHASVLISKEKQGEENLIPSIKGESRHWIVQSEIHCPCYSVLHNTHTLRFRFITSSSMPSHTNLHTRTHTHLCTHVTHAHTHTSKPSAP